ncbi:MAG: cell division protein ZapA, partial [Pseudomonadota bacterium]
MGQVTVNLNGHHYTIGCADGDEGRLRVLAEDLDKLVNSRGPTGESIGAQIINADIVGIINLQGAHISGSGNVFAGVRVGNKD